MTYTVSIKPSIKPSSSDLATGFVITAHLRTLSHLSQGFEINNIALYRLSYPPAFGRGGWIRASNLDDVMFPDIRFSDRR